MDFLRSIFYNENLRKKILFTLGMIVVYRIGSHIPISGIDVDALKQLFQGGVLGFVNLFSGGGLSRFSIFALGILPYINASIIMQLLTILWPKLKELTEEGESGRKQISQYTRYLAIVLAFFQSIMMAVSFRAFVNPDVNFMLFLFYAVIGLVAGSALIMWFAELVTEFGIGNGASLIIFVGIVAQMPMYINSTWILVKGGTSIFMV
ncbi:MAG: preprotein translocase subunit SecY, partial [Candidatus Margulisiibacteriota bacterium]